MNYCVVFIQGGRCQEMGSFHFKNKSLARHSHLKECLYISLFCILWLYYSFLCARTPYITEVCFIGAECEVIEVILLCSFGPEAVSVG